MKIPGKARVLAGMIVGLLAIPTSALPAARTAGQCQAEKMRVAGEDALGKLTCHARSAATGDPLSLVCLARTEAVFAKKMAAIEATGSCPTSGNSAAIEADVYSFISKVVAALPLEIPASVDLRSYFPTAANTYRTFAGRAQSKYNFFFATRDSSDPFWSLYSSLFDQEKPDGQLLIWQKIYASNANDPENLNCTATYAHLFLGGAADKSVVEVGDWLNNDGKVPEPCPDNYRALGYQRTESFATPATGLNWSGPAGLDSRYSSFQSGYVFDQPKPQTGYGYNGSREYSTPGLVEFLPSWSPEYGRASGGAWGSPGKTYTSVVHMVLFHGVSGEVLCDPARSSCAPDRSSCAPDRSNPYSAYYLHVPGFRSYAIELYMDQEHGILQETLLYDEQGFFQQPPCALTFPALAPGGGPGLTEAFHSWRWYLDD